MSVQLFSRGQRGPGQSQFGRPGTQAVSAAGRGQVSGGGPEGGESRAAADGKAAKPVARWVLQEARDLAASAQLTWGEALTSVLAASTTEALMERHYVPAAHFVFQTKCIEVLESAAVSGRRGRQSDSGAAEDNASVAGLRNAGSVRNKAARRWR